MPCSPAVAVCGRRVCALLAVCSAALHAVMLGQAGTPFVAALLVVMVGVCLFCAWELWFTGSLRAWTLVALMNLGMVAVHATSVGHHHGAPVHLITGAPSPSALMALATGVAAVEVVAATAVLFYRTRDRAARLGAGGALS